MSSDMLRLAKTDLWVASLCISENPQNDEVRLNFAGYHCSQAAEKLVKYAILERGEIPPKSHKVFELINFMVNRGMDVTLLDELYSNAFLLDAWSIETRYIVNSLATHEQVKKVIKVLTEILELFEKQSNRVENSAEDTLAGELSAAVESKNQYGL